MLPCWLNPFCKDQVAFVAIDAFSLHSFVLMLLPLFFLRRRGKSAGYLLCFYLFSIYAWAVLAYTIFEFPVYSTLVEQVKSRSWSNEIRLIPALLAGREFNPSSVQVYGNFLLGIPFGFGWPFLLARTTHRRILLSGLGFAAGLEIAQLLLGLILYQAPYRVIDIDDVWLVFAGTLVGYGALWAAASLYRRIGWERGAGLPVWSHFHEVLRRVASVRPPAVASAAGDDNHGAPGQAGVKMARGEG